MTTSVMLYGLPIALLSFYENESSKKLEIYNIQYNLRTFLFPLQK